MGLIFYLSHQPAVVSAKSSGFITEVVVQYLSQGMNKLPSVDMEYFVRKAAHLTLYTVLGSLIYLALFSEGWNVGKTLKYAWVLLVLYAISDETHQLFVAGRSGEMRDVLIDSIGGSLGILVTCLFIHRIKQKKMVDR